jgi:Sec-independent protein secretion pathway component TatC
MMALPLWLLYELGLLVARFISVPKRDGDAVGEEKSAG